MGHFYLNKAEGGEEMERLCAFQTVFCFSQVSFQKD